MKRVKLFALISLLFVGLGHVWEEITAYTAGDVGNYVIATLSNGKYYALPNNPTINSGKITGVEITTETTADNVVYVSASNAVGYTWTIANATNGQTISDGSKYIYHSNGGSSSTNLAYGTSTSYTWVIEKENTGLTFKAMNGTTTNTRGMLCNGTTFGGYALSNEDASGYNRIVVLPIGSSGGVTYTDNFLQQAGTHTTPTCRGKRSRYVPPAHPNKSHLHLHETPINSLQDNALMVLYTGFNGKVNKKLMVNYTTITCLSFHDNYMYPLRKMSNPDPYLEGRGGYHLRLFYFSLYVKDHLRSALLGYGSSVYLSDGILYLQIQKSSKRNLLLTE